MCFPLPCANVRTFREGYRITDADFATILPQVHDLQLIKAFDLVRWAIDRRPDAIPNHTERARDTLKPRSENTLAA